jgi:subtilase family serine protease
MIIRVLLAALTLGFSIPAFALPHHRAVMAGDPTPASACVYPDGTSPANRPWLHCYGTKEFLAAYGIDKLHAAGITGKGQTIILADSFGSPTLQADLDHFSDTFGLPHTTIQFIYPDGPYVNPMQTDDQVSWAGETTLDLEWAHAVAPDATLVNIVTNVSETTGLTGFPDLFKGFQMAAQQYPGAIISMSFGTGEPTFLDSDLVILKGQFHDILKQATDAGITLLASSGDSGSTNMNTDQTSLIGFANASYPATDPYITAVGGTSLQAGWNWAPTGSADDYWNCKLNHTTPCPTDFLASVTATDTRETVWKEDWALAGGGGGISQIFGAADFQSQVAAKFGEHRTIPDLSLNAAINGGVDVYTSYAPAPGQPPKAVWQSFGGTSCSSPETAALVALAGQKASDTLGRQVGIGYLNPLLYSLSAGDFRDIVTESVGTTVAIGDNGLYFSPTLLSALGATRVPPVAVPGYPTTVGYDLATGLGTPHAEKFVLDLAAARVAQSKITLP